jgi:hypothetical protein
MPDPHAGRILGQGDDSRAATVLAFLALALGQELVVGEDVLVDPVLVLVGFLDQRMDVCRDPRVRIRRRADRLETIASVRARPHPSAQVSVPSPERLVRRRRVKPSRIRVVDVQDDVLCRRLAISLIDGAADLHRFARFGGICDRRLPAQRCRHAFVDQRTAIAAAAHDRGLLGRVCHRSPTGTEPVYSENEDERDHEPHIHLGSRRRLAAFTATHAGGTQDRGRRFPWCARAASEGGVERARCLTYKTEVLAVEVIAPAALRTPGSTDPARRCTRAPGCTRPTASRAARSRVAVCAAGRAAIPCANRARPRVPAAAGWP